MQYERAVSLTDSAGTFFVVASSDWKADSILVGVVTADRPLVVGVPFSLEGVQTIPQTTTYTDTQNKGGRSGCDSPNIATRTRIIAYSYYPVDQTIALNW